MNERGTAVGVTLIAPARLHEPQFGALVHTVAVAALRTYVRVSRRALRGRGVGFACVAVARLAARDGKVTFRLGSGGLFRVDPEDRYWVRPLLVDATYEPDLDWFLARGLRPYDHFVDCGANSGVWSVAASRVIDDRSRTVAVEAGATAFARLARNAAANPERFTTLHSALSDESGQIVEFFSDDSDTASASLVQAMATKGAASENVITVTLTDLLPRAEHVAHKESLTFLKLDIEGMEETVIGSCPTAVFDDVIVMYEDHGRDLASATTAMLLERGFVVWLLLDDRGAVSITDATQVRPHKTDPRKGYNLVAVRPASRGEARVHATLG